MRCSIDEPVTTKEDPMKLTRTLGAALGFIAVLLFFASLTLEQDRVASLIARATQSARR
jgi:hypothetical protein